ncbi:MAG: FixH family protein [Paenibacillaceae bacterium]
MCKKVLCRLMMGIFLLAILSACSAKPQGQDPSSVKVELVTDPSPAQSTQKVKITAQISGLNKRGVLVQFDIQKADKSDLVDVLNAHSGEEGSYYVEKTFDEPGTYNVYIHLLQGEMHLTKKRQLVVL